jgi:hypothetical protein
MTNRVTDRIILSVMPSVIFNLWPSATNNHPPILTNNLSLVYSRESWKRITVNTTAIA